MNSEKPKLYDAIYSLAKNYSDEGRKLEACIRRFRPEAVTLLDVACGTGEHAWHLGHRYEIDGIDIDPEMIALARNKNPKGRFTQADMRDFDLDRRYDVVTCLFSSIGYVGTREGLRNAIRSCARHLKPGGLLIVEPWFTPEQWIPGKLGLDTVDRKDLKVARMCVSGITDEGQSRLQFDYLVAIPGEQTRHFTEEHLLGLFTREEMEAEFKATGLQVFHDDEGIFGRGLYIAAN